MILRIFLIFLFIILGSFLLFFVYGIFIPAIKSQLKENQDPLFSEVELNYIEKTAVDDVKTSDERAVVFCNPKKTFDKERLVYNGIKNCALFNSIYSTSNDCAFGCIGFGDCVNVCPQEAISIVNNTAVISENCCGCGKCQYVCPKSLIKMVPKSQLKKGEMLKICNAQENCLTTCSKCGVNEKIEIREEKHFKLWQKCYTMLFRK